MDRYITRQIEDRILRLAAFFPVVIVIGARQVGKTTLLKHLFADADYVAFDPTIDVENARSDPDLFLNNHREPLVLDEIQYAPEVISAIKRRVDEDRQPGRFILTGSQQWSVLKNISESLAGRAVILEVDGFSLPEICGMMDTRTPWLEHWLDAPLSFAGSSRSGTPLPYSLYEHLFRGSLPESTALPLDVLRLHLQSYQRTYIERDVRLLTSLANEQLFGRFFQLASTLTAQEINYTQLGRELGVTPKTAGKWLSIMRGTFQWHEIPPYHGNAVKRISGKKKGYISDTGVACMAQAIGSPAALGGHPMLGALFETAVVSELIRQTRLMECPPNLYHWRSHSGAEVDLLLESDGAFYPVEIKVKTNPSKNDTRGITAFRKTYPHLKTAPGLVLCCCQHSFQLSPNDYAMPWNIIE
ncbi:MAG: ATP-binding protein [Planctomycetota bacterium]|jgi:predicted AAA+ superfamily ATPase